MDLSPIIFVVLVLAWAVYLIPKALSHHDEVAGARLEEGHTDKVRILTRARRATTTVTASSSSAPAVEADVEVVVASEVVASESLTSTEEVRETVSASVPEEPVASVAPTASSTSTEQSAPVGRPVPAPAAPRRTPSVTRASARRAARNRRRVLSVLTGVLLVVVGLSLGGVVPAWGIAVPAALVVGFLVLARVSVRRMHQAHRGTAPATRPTAPRPTVARPSAGEPVAAPAAPVDVDDTEAALEELTHEQSPERRVEVETALSESGSLWDPLPLTVPTYVTKARARRTVRTIELTGITSSGHDAADSAVAREAAERAALAEAGEALAGSKVVGG